MASRTQIRLEQLTGSLSAPESLGSEVALASLEAAHLGELLGEMGQAIARIHGEKDFTSKSAGVFSHTQTVFSGSLKSTSDALIEGNAAILGASDLQGDITGSAGLLLAGAALFQSDFEAQGAITFSAQEGANSQDPDVGIAGHLGVQGEAGIGSKLFVGDTATIQGNITGSAGLLLAGAADLNGALDVAGAVNLAATGVATDIRGTLSVDEAAVFDSTVQIDGDADLNGELDVQGAVNLQSDLTAAGAITFSQVTGTSAASDPDVAISGHVNIAKDAKVAGALELTGAADLNGALDVNGAVDLAAAGVLTNVRGTLSVDEAATFDDDVTISGNLTVAGSTTTVNTETVTIADHNIVLDSNNSTGAVINGAGITMEGGSGDDLTFQWSTADQDMELKLGASFAKLHIGDLAAADAVFSADVAAVNADFSGTLEAGGEATLASAIISDLTDNRVVIAGASGAIEDDVNFTFDGTELAVGSSFTVQQASGLTRVGKLEIDSANDFIDIDNNVIKVKSAIGVLGLHDGVNYYSKFVKDSTRNLKILSEDILFGYDDGVNPPAEVARIDGSASSLLMSGSNKIEFRDSGEAIFSHANGRLGLISNGVEYQFPAADGAENYVLATDASGVLTWKSISAVSAATGKKINKKITTAIDTADGNGDYVYDYSGFTASEKAAISDADNTVLDVYLNGQMLVGYKNGTPIGPNADYDWNIAGEELLFAFPIEVDDTLTIVVR